MMRLVVTLAISIILTSCSLTKPVKLPNVNTYALNEVQQKRLVKIPSMKTIFVAEPYASPGFQSKDIVYFERPFDLQTYSVNQWVAPPSQMIKPLLVKSLQNSGFFAGVVSAPHTGVTDYVISTRIIELAQFFTYEGSILKLSMSAVLMDRKTQKIIAERNFKSQVTVADETPYSAVVAANRATADMLQQITAFTVPVLQRQN